MERQSQAKHKNRDERLTIRFTNEEKAEIIEKANACGLKPNEYCRRLILGHKPRLMPSILWAMHVPTSSASTMC